MSAWAASRPAAPAVPRWVSRPACRRGKTRDNVLMPTDTANLRQDAEGCGGRLADDVGRHPPMAEPRLVAAARPSEIRITSHCARRASLCANASVSRYPTVSVPSTSSENRAGRGDDEKELLTADDDLGSGRSSGGIGDKRHEAHLLRRTRARPARARQPRRLARWSRWRSRPRVGDGSRPPSRSTVGRSDARRASVRCARNTGSSVTRLVSAIADAARFSSRLENAVRATASSSTARPRDCVETSCVVMSSSAPSDAATSRRQRSGDACLEPPVPRDCKPSWL